MSQLYRSPFAVLDLSPADVNPVTVRQARRRLLTEFELRDALVLELGDVEYMRNDVEQLADELLDPKLLNFHRLVHEDAALQKFLETGKATDLRYGPPK